jgi:hypothetical protein
VDKRRNDARYFVAFSSDIILPLTISGTNNNLLDTSDILINDYDTQVSNLTYQIKSKDESINELINTLHAREVTINNLKSGYFSKEVIIFPTQTKMWIRISKLYVNIINIVMPCGSRLRTLYDLLMSGTIVLVEEGGLVFVIKSTRYILKKIKSKNLQTF